MGEIIVDIELENAEDRSDVRRGRIDEESVRRARIEAVADTGAVMLALPEDVVANLGLPTLRTLESTFADGRRGQLPVAGPLTIRIGDRQALMECVVVPEGAEALIGQVVMETLDLIPDPVNQTLGPRPESPDRPLLRV
ncbi:MAG: clan AA aspartic protease [Chloroflexota bacterium]|nr:clan AA aspartic protease [Chloroflexota bacterium]